MRPSLIEKTLTTLVKIKQPTMLWGSPGIGKSQLVASVADKLFGGKKKKVSDYFIDLRASLLDVVDVRGLPVHQNGKTVWVPPSFFPTSGEGILFLDELVQASPLVMSGLSQLVLDRAVGEYHLPDGWSIVAAGNNEKDRAATHRMPSQLANRFLHLDYEVHHGDWIAWAHTHNIDKSVIAFLLFCPDMLNQFDAKRRVNATPRSWAFASNVVSAGVDDECFIETIAGAVGTDIAETYTGFFRVFRSIPQLEDIVADPASAIVPEKADALYAVTTMLVFSTEKKFASKVYEYIGRLPKDFQILFHRDVTKKHPEVSETKAYIDWTVKNQDLLLNR